MNTGKHGGNAMRTLTTNSAEIAVIEHAGNGLRRFSIDVGCDRVLASAAVT